MSRILLIEDDRQIGNGVVSGLKHFGMTVDWFCDGQQGYHALLDNCFDAVLLDLTLPKLDGMQILSQWRQANIHTPVLILTARDAIANRVAGLNAGADDYLTKPFALEEVVARLQALIRRSQGRQHSLLSHGNLSLNPTTRQVWLADTLLDLTAKEINLLELLLSQPNKIHSRAELEDKLYGWTQELESNAIEVHIHHLRKKIGSHIITTKRGLGYQLGQAR